MSVKVIFRKEVQIDLNEYYASFPPAVRRVIDDALFNLLGGAPKGTGKSMTRPHGVKPTRDDVVMRLTADRPPPKAGSKIRILYEELKREYPNGFPYGKAKDMAKKLGEGSTLASSLKSLGYLTEV